MTLDQLDALPAFALLAPGFTGSTRWTLLQDLRAGRGDVTLWLAGAETPGHEALALTGDVTELDLTFPASPALDVLLDETGFLDGVRVVREAIAAGDVYQVNLTLRATVKAVSGSQILSTLCRAGVPRFAAWVRFNGWEFVSGSPELLVERHGAHLHAEPMKGTAAPEQLEQLRTSEKDVAELAMITDLIRNDFQSLCVPRSVHVSNARRFIELPYVVQAVSDVGGTLRPGLGVDEVLSVMHPGGSVTGAPRPAAQRFIASLERSPRGLYCGALGWERGDDARVALLIRTAQRTGPSTWTYGVGSGITWDSVPELELAEVRLKLGALRP